MSKFVWFEYVTQDAAKAQGFFGELFGWTTREVPMGGTSYAMIAVGDRTIGGYATEAAGAAHWLAHLEVASAQETAAKIEKLGGRVVRPATKIGEFGTMALVTDPQGGAFALWQPAKSEDTPPRAPNTFCWNELAAADPAAAVTFYTAIGGFTAKTMQMEEGPYHVLESGGQPRAGIGPKLVPTQPHAWLPYVEVANADRAVEKATKLGATIVVPPTDVPNVGRFAIFSDPQGATLGVLQP